MVAHVHLMDHWRKQFGDRILTISYEELVRGPEAATSELLAYCALDWSDSCLRFFEDVSPSTTASATKIPRPIYTTSIGRWRNYESELSEVAAKFQSSSLECLGRA